MDKIEQLYKLYIEKGLITSKTSLEDFAGSNEDVQSKLYELGKTEGLFVTTGLNDFQSAWTPAPAKTLDSADVDPTVESKNGTGSDLVDFSLESQPMDPFLVNGEPVTEEEFNKVKSGNEEEMGYLGKLWTDIKKGSSSLGEMMASVPETIYNIFAIPQNVISELTGIESLSTSSKKFKKRYDIENPILDFYEKESEELGKVQDIYNNKNYEYQGIYNNFKKGNYIDGFKQLGSGIAESAPVSISMMVGGAAASTGELAAASTVVMGGPEISKQLDNDSQSELAGVIKGLGLAGAESVFSSIGTGTLGRVYKDIILKEGKEAGVKVFRNGLMEMYSTALKKVGAPISMFGEGVEEVATTITQNMINGINAFDNVADSFIQGVGGGGFYGAPINVAQAQKAVSDGITNVKINRDLKGSDFTSVVEPFTFSDSNDLQLQILKNKGAFELINNKVDKEVIGGRISKEKGDEIKINVRNTQESFNTIEKTDIASSDKVKAVNLLKEKRNNENKIKSIGDASLTQAESDRVKVINEELNSLVQKGVLENASAELSKNIESVEKVSKKIKGVSVKSLDNAEAIDSFVKDNDLDIDKKSSENQGFIYQDPKTGEQVIVINKEVAKKEQAVNVAGHEFLHGLIFQTVKNSPETQLALGKSLNEYINKIDTKQVKDSYFAERLESYKDMDEATQSEEVLTLFSDAIATGDIQFNEGVFTKIGDVIRRTLQNLGVNIKFNNGKDVYNFVKDYNKSIKKGSLTRAQKIAANKGVKGSLVLGKTKENATDVKESKSTSATPLEAINNLIPNTVKTQAEYFSPRVFNPIYNALEDNGVISNYIKSKSPSKEVASKTIESIRERLINFDPEATRKNKDNAEPITFGEFIFANTNFGKLDAKKALFKESQEDSNKIDIDSEQAKGVVATESVSKKAEAPKYRKIIDSNVLFKDVVSNVKEKVLKTVRTLKSKLDANVSKNKTVTPIIAEIKKEMGKQADIDLKKAIGGKANSQMERFLIKNKKAILENMTTTWLTKAIPTSIQKMVGGNWTSEWQGKKIDRESAKTDNAGRTSGAEMIRRKPNVSGMADAEFLSYFLDSKGNPIRGRKESLAKAMAEEISLEIFNRELQDENSDISKAFENNQQLKGVELTEGFVAEVSKQVERGNVKFSKAALPYVGKLVKLGINKGIDEVVDTDGNILVNIEGLDEIDSTGLGAVVRKAFDIGLVPDGKELRFLQSIQGSKIIPQGIKDLVKRAITSKSELTVRKDLAKDMVTVANSLGSDVTDIIGFDGLGFFNRLLDSAKTKKDKITGEIIPGGKGDFYDTKVDMIKNQPKSSGLPSNYNGAEVSPMNSKTGVMGKISRILNKDITAKKKREEYKKLIPEIEAANVQNKILAKYIITKLINLVQDGKISPKSFISILQAQTNATQGLRALTGLKYITFKDGPQGNMKGEHLADNGTSMFEIAELGFENNTKKELSFKIDGILEFHDQWLENREVLDFVDQFGKSNPNKDLRIRLLANKDQAFVYTYDLRPAENLIAERESAIKSSNTLEKSINFKELNTVETQQKAVNNARSIKWSKSPKKIRVFDFDDTLARTNSKVLYTMPDGTKGKIDAATFAEEASRMEAEGAVWDFSEFSKVMDGKKGPLFEVAKIIADKKGTKDVFVLTARPQDAAGPIQEFLSELGLDIPIENITGLSDGNPKAKANWMISKVAEGYNDFYFADDHTGNVKAVKDILDTFDVKGRVQLAKVKFSKSLDPEFNSMIERNKGVGVDKEFSRIVAKRRGANKGKYKAFITSSADDFRGLTSYTFAGKGKQGEADQAFFEDALLTPYFRGVNALESARVTIKSDFKQLGKIFKPEVKKLSKLTPDGDFTYDQALRVFMWNKQGTEIPGISKRDQAKLVKLIEEDAGLKAFSEAAVLATKKDGWPDPGEYWDAKTILSDLNDLTETSNRAEYLTEFIENADIIFSEKNLNKIEAVYGTRHREALEDALYAMKNGTNRSSGSNKITNKWNNWVNNSIGTIMFFNRRSALMQTLSIANFLNWSDNNPLKASLAFANQPQYWKDFVMIFNSDKLKQRRGGLKSDVQEAEIANAAKGAKNKPQAIISYLLKKGFLTTQIADSFAISMGGASMYRNRVNTYKKQGLDQKVAEEKAFLDFSKLSDETQQSGDPAMVSQQQRSIAGRLILSFQNTTMQYTRLMKKSAQDLINGRGDAKTNISKIIYYGAVQNFIFNALSASLFALIPGFGDEDEEEIDEKELDKKSTKILNGMFDSVAKGTGIYGAVVVTLKNAYRKYTKEKEKGFMGQPGWQTASEMLNIAPAIGSKFKKVKSAIDVAEKYDKDIIEKHPWDVAIGGRFNPSSTYTVIGNLSSALLNIPLDRALAEAKGISEMLDDRNTTFQRVALGLGWRTWDVGAKNEEFDLIKSGAKKEKKKKKSNSKKASNTPVTNKTRVNKTKINK